MGLELEFSGLKLEKVSEIIRDLYGGSIKESHRYRYEIFDTDLGDFEVELDARLLKKMARNDFFEGWEQDFEERLLKDSLSDIVDKMAKAVVPLEIVMPPVKVEQLPRLEKLRSRLQQQKAKGTETSWMHAFGMHINIEIPVLESNSILRYLKAFFILYPWLLEKMDIDFTRRISPFIDHFPDPYVHMVLDDSYNPDLQQLVSDYLEHSPTRNRPLDMMPIWAMVDEQQVSEALGDEKNRPRPTFHYRLPNSKVDNPDWTFDEEWNNWVAVERLAADDDMLRKLSRLYLFREKEKFVAFRKEWAQTVTILLDLDA